MTDSDPDAPESDREGNRVRTGDIDLPPGARACAECATPLTPVDYHPGQRHCSRACQLRAHRRSRGHVPMGTVVTRVCSECGERFTSEQRKRPRIRCDACRRRVSHHKQGDTDP